MNFIEELYYGNIRLNTQEHISTGTHKQATAIISRITAQLRETLSEPERTLLERLTEAHNEVLGETGAAEFKIGFALGVRMMADCHAVNIDKNKSYSSRPLWFENSSYFVGHAIRLLFWGR